jgi:PAS domain S-box-containing protein
MLLVALAGTIGVILAVVLIGRLVFLERYQALEKQTVQEKMERTARALALTTENLERVAVDWAVWDASYDFMETGDEAFANENLAGDSVANIDVDAMALLDNQGGVKLLASADGRVAYGADAGLGLSALVKATGSELVGVAGAGPVSGVVGSPSGPVLVAIHPILPSEGQGAARGVLVVARALDQEVLNSMSALTGTKVAAYLPGDPGLSAEQPWLAAELGWEGVTLVRPLGGDLMAGFVGFRDIFGQPALVLEAQEDRPGYREASRVVWIFGSALVALWLVAGGVAYFLVRRLAESRGKLEASERWYRAVLERSREGMILVDHGSGTIMEANQAFAELSGYAPTEMAGLALAAVLDDPEVLVASAERQEGGLVPTDHRTRCRRKDGGEVEVEVSVSVIQQGASEVLSLTVRDITKRRQVEEALRESESRYQTLVNLSPDAMVVNAGGKYVFANPAAARLFGVGSPRELLGQNGLERVHPDDRELVTQRVAQIVAGSEAAPVEIKLLRLDGGPVTVETSTAMIEFDGRPAAQVVFRDITERKRMEHTLRIIQYSVDHAADNIFWIDQDGRITYASKATCERLGYTLEEMLHLNIYDIDTAAPSPWHEHWEKVRDEGRRTFEVIHRAKDGTCVPVEVSTNLVVYEGKEYHFSYARDITERKRAEEERERLQSQLLQAQKMESVGRLAGGVAHDFNNMLEVILGHAELAMDQLGQSHPVSSDLWEIRRAAERSANITRQLLAFARRQIVVPKVIDLNETVTGTIKMLERLISESIELLWRPGDNLGSVEMDPAQIDQILVNLCINARDALRSTGRITIETAAASIDEAYSAMHEGSVPGEYVVLTVSDNGCGMDQDLLAHMFEPFFTTKETGKGTGLGLATIYGIVKQNCGFLDVQSEPSRGT